MSSLEPPADLSGTVVAGIYRVERLVGKGAMGSVWAAHHTTLHHAVAVKFIHPALASKPDALRRFETEAKAAAKLKSRHVVQVYDHGVTPEGQPYIVMEYLEGESLEATLRRRGPLPEDEVLGIIDEAALALEVAHAAGVVHRDLKPDNIMLAIDPEAKRGYTVKLVDFGIAKLLTDDAASSGATRAGSVVGTPHYMAPEALTASSPIGPGSDVWSLGACAFAALVGKTPFDGDAIGDVVLKVCAAPLPVPSEHAPRVPPGFDVWFARACQRDPERRFPSIAALREALAHLDRLSREGSDDIQYRLRTAEPSIHDPIATPTVPPASNRILVMAGVVLGASLAVGGLGVYVWKRTDEANEAILQASAQAAASVRAENQTREEAAERALWASQYPDATTDAAPSPSSRRPPPRKR